jgi:hypothetical protein
MELIIQDVMLSIVPDTLISKDEIKKIAQNIPAAERKDYYYVKGTTLTLVNNKKYKEQKFEAKVNSTYVTASGKVYGFKNLNHKVHEVLNHQVHKASWCVNENLCELCANFASLVVKKNSINYG